MIKKQSKSISNSLPLSAKNLAYPIFLVQDIFIDNFNGYVFDQKTIQNPRDLFLVSGHHDATSSWEYENLFKRV